ncbi:MAG: M23 family metallopeptidase [Eubacteriales bacterium]
MNRKIVSKFSNFVLGNGFYIALTLCVALIVLSGYYLMESLSPTTTVVTPVSGVPEIIIPEEEPVVSTTPELPEIVTPVITPEPVVPVVQAEEEEELPEEEQPEEELPEEELPELLEEEVVLSYCMPTVGEVTQIHSMDVLIYHAVMGDWRTHEGIDIAANIGTEVMSVADGVVSAVYEDDMMGTTLVISHGDEIQSVYANLGEFPSVAVDDWVLGGQIIAVVGDSALAESGSEPHLQFSMRKNGESVDPMDYLPEDLGNST